MPSATASHSVLGHPDCSTENRGPVLPGVVVRKASWVPGSLDLPDFANLVTYPSCRIGGGGAGGGGSRPLRVSSFSSGLLAGHSGSLLHVY